MTESCPTFDAPVSSLQYIYVPHKLYIPYTLYIPIWLSHVPHSTCRLAPGYGSIYHIHCKYRIYRIHCRYPYDWIMSHTRHAGRLIATRLDSIHTVYTVCTTYTVHTPSTVYTIYIWYTTTVYTVYTIDTRMTESCPTFDVPVGSSLWSTYHIHCIYLHTISTVYTVHIPYTQDPVYIY